MNRVPRNFVSFATATSRPAPRRMAGQPSRHSPHLDLCQPCCHIAAQRGVMQRDRAGVHPAAPAPPRL